MKFWTIYNAFQGPNQQGYNLVVDRLARIRVLTELRKAEDSSLYTL